VPAPCTAPSPFFSGNPQLLSTYPSSLRERSRTGQWATTLCKPYCKSNDNGLQYQVAYTYSKCMTNNSGYYGSWGAQATTASRTGKTSTIQRPNGAMLLRRDSFTDSLLCVRIADWHGSSFGKDMNPVLNAVVGGWTISPIISLHTGFPMTPYGNDHSETNSRSAWLVPTAIPLPHVQGRVPGAGFGGYPVFYKQRQLQRYHVGDVWNLPAQLGWLRGPGYDNWDLSPTEKTFKLTERYTGAVPHDFVNAVQPCEP